MFQSRIPQNELLIIRAVMRRENLKGEDRIVEEGVRIYSHTNTRGRKRYIQICGSQHHADATAKQTDGKFFKSWGSWICIYE